MRLNNRCIYCCGDFCSLLRKPDCESCRFVQTEKTARQVRQASYNRRKALGLPATAIDMYELRTGQLLDEEITVVARGKQVDYSAARRMYMDGYTDEQIAGKLDCTENTIARWRGRNGLPVNKRKGRRQGRNDTVHADGCGNKG